MEPAWRWWHRSSSPKSMIHRGRWRHELHIEQLVPIIWGHSSETQTTLEVFCPFLCVLVYSPNIIYIYINSLIHLFALCWQIHFASLSIFRHPSQQRTRRKSLQEISVLQEKLHHTGAAGYQDYQDTVKAQTQSGGAPYGDGMGWVASPFQPDQSTICRPHDRIAGRSTDRSPKRSSPT